MTHCISQRPVGVSEAVASQQNEVSSVTGDEDEEITVFSMHYNSNSLFKTSLLLDVFSSSRSHSFMHFKFSSDAILIFSNSSLMQFRYKADTFHAVFALEILAPCISVHIFHAHRTSVACISVHAH